MKRSDIIWYNSQTGETQIWFMEGHRLTGRETVLDEKGQFIPIGPPFSIVGVGDMNGDGKADIVWYNSQTGETQIWFMEGHRLTGRETVLDEKGQFIPIGPPFSIVGVGDMNGDGKADIVWYNSQTGETQIWFMEGHRLTGRETVLDEKGQFIPIGPPFSIVGVGEFNPPAPPSPAQSGPEWFVIDAPSITFGTGIAVGGFGRLTVFSDGTTHLQGHLHDSGFASFDCLVVFTLKDADGRAYAADHSGRIRGTIEPGSRDLDWDKWGTNDLIRENWAKIRTGGSGAWRVEVTSDFTPLKIIELVVAAVGLVLAVIPLIFSGGSSDKSSDPDYGRPEAYPPGGLPPPERSVGGA